MDQASSPAFSPTEMLDYQEDRLVSVTAAGDYLCLQCPAIFKAPRKHVVQRHYANVHKVAFKKSRSSLSRRLDADDIKSSFEDEGDLIRCAVRVTANLNLPFRSWDDPQFRRFIRPFEQFYKVRLSARTVRAKVLSSAEKVREKVKNTLCGELFSLKFDIASRKGKSFLGLTVQIIKDWKIHVLNLGLIPLEGSLSADYLQEQIYRRLNAFGLDVGQIVTITTDNGANVLLASLEIVTESIGPIEEVVDCPISDDEDDDDDEDHHDSDDSEDWMDVDTIPRTQLDVGVVADIVDEAIINSLFAENKRLRCAAHSIQLAVQKVLKPLARQISRLRHEAKKCRRYIAKHRLSWPPISNSTR